jgi:hypothetical protein
MLYAIQQHKHSRLISQGSGVKVLNLNSASETDMRDEQGDPDESAIEGDLEQGKVANMSGSMHK